MFKIGERVRYLDDVGEATIVEFIDDKNVVVEDEYGLTHPHPINKLVSAERDHVPQVKKAPVIPTPTPISKPKNTPKKPVGKTLPELAIAFVSTSSSKPETGDLDVVFCNRTKHSILINIGAKENEEWFSVFNGEIATNTDKTIQSLRRQDVGTLSNLQVDVIFFGKTGYQLKQPVSCKVKIKATRFVKPGNYERFIGLNNPAIAIAIGNEKLPQSEPTSFKKRPVPVKQKPSLPTIEEEVDLHLDKILGEEPIGMPDHEKFLTQMRHFERKLNHALTHRYVQITFIHGVGSGRLKDAIRKELTEYNLPFEDGAYHKYGVGATVVHLH